MRRGLLVGGVLTIALSLVAAGCGGGGKKSSSGGGGGASGVQALPASSCSGVYYQGSGNANYVIAHPGTTAADILQLAETVRDRVKERTGVRLERELHVW